MRKEFIIPKADKSNYFRVSELLEYIYNNPKKVRVYASNGYTRQLTPHEDCVII